MKSSSKEHIQDTLQLESPFSFSHVLRDHNARQLFRDKLDHLPHDSYTVNIAYDKIYILVNLNHYLELLAQEQPENTREQSNSKSVDIESKYALKISKSFPLKNSLKIHLLNGGFQPKICDTRDLFQQVMGEHFNFKISFDSILKKIVQFDKKLHHLNQLFPQMQKLGKFSLGQKYYYQEISQLYSSLTLFKDFSQKKSSVYVGLTETHIIIFKEFENNTEKQPKDFVLKHSKTVIGPEQTALKVEDQPEGTQNPLILVCCTEMQCIDTIYYKQHEKTLRIVFKKYQSIKLYHEFEEIKRQYKFNHPQVFLRGVLKVITKFQHCEVIFDPYRAPEKKEKKPSINEDMVKYRQTQRINFFIDESNRLQLLLKKQPSEQQRKKQAQPLIKYYRKLIQYYSARANPYYLIYVNKLNNIYSKYYLPHENSQIVKERRNEGLYSMIH